MTPRIAIIGTVGVPARYGGFETLAENLAKAISPETAELTIYCQRSAYPGESGPFAGHRRVFLPLRANGAASIVHDWLAILHAAFIGRASCLLVLGVSGAAIVPIVRVLRPATRIVTNIDGMEWRRDKFGHFTKSLLQLLEWLAVHGSHHVIADNAAIADMARRRYAVEPTVIAYGGDHTLVDPDPAEPVEAPGFWLSVARIEPENNCAMILEAFAASSARLVFIGNWSVSRYAVDLRSRYAGYPNLILLDPVYDLRRLAAWRAAARGYVHGHSVGGTNPSLVEALFWTTDLLAFDCSFNRATTDGAGRWFSSAAGLVSLLGETNHGDRAPATFGRLRERYRWAAISEAYRALCSGI